MAERTEGRAGSRGRAGVELRSQKTYEGQGGGTDDVPVYGSDGD